MTLSLAARVRLLVSLVVAVVVTVVAVTAYQRFRSAYLGHLDGVLELMARGVAVASDPAEAIGHMADSPWRGPETHFRVWLEGATEDIAASAARDAVSARFLWELPAGDPPSLDRPRFTDLAHKSKRYRAIWLRRAVAGGVENIVIAHPASFEHRRLRELLVALLVTAAAMVGIGATLGTRLVLVALRPLAATTERVARVREDAPDSQDFLREPVPRELEPLVREIARLLERLGAALGQQRRFVADASHQLRTPLSVLHSTLDVARDGDPARHRQAITEALEDVARMQRIVDQLLILARVQHAPGAGTVELCLDALLAEVAVANDRDGRLRCERLAPCSVRGDETMLRWLFENLVQNAQRYGPPSGVVRLGLEYGPAGSCTATVQDDGGSLPSDALERVFDRFYRAADSPGGAGLGLSIAREVARRHGGDVWVTSSPGVRTTFHVRLPATLRPETTP